jgi:hypothetical protein
MVDQQKSGITAAHNLSLSALISCTFLTIAIWAIIFYVVGLWVI